MVIICLLIVAGLIGIDQLFKILAVDKLVPGTTLPVIKIGQTEIFNLTYCENTGAAFSFFSGKQIFLIIFTVIALVALSIFVCKTKSRSKLLTISYMLILAGGVGNLIDRIAQGYVVDYIEFRLFEFAVFNFADICVVIGGILMVVFVFVEEKKALVLEKSKAEKDKKSNGEVDE